MKSIIYVKLRLLPYNLKCIFSDSFSDQKWQVSKYIGDNYSDLHIIEDKLVECNWQGLEGNNPYRVRKHLWEEYDIYQSDFHGDIIAHTNLNGCNYVIRIRFTEGLLNSVIELK